MTRGIGTGGSRRVRGANPPFDPLPLCDIPSGCGSFTGPWTVTRSSLRMLRRVAAFCRPLRPCSGVLPPPLSRPPQRPRQPFRDRQTWAPDREPMPVSLEFGEAHAIHATGARVASPPQGPSNWAAGCTPVARALPHPTCAQ